MPGKTGMLRTIKTETHRQKMWQTMRIKRRGFTAVDLIITVPGASKNNAYRLLAQLLAHGIISKTGTDKAKRRSEYGGYRLRKDTGPKLPNVCPYCKKRMTEAGCGGVNL